MKHQGWLHFASHFNVQPDDEIVLGFYEDDGKSMQFICRLKDVTFLDEMVAMTDCQLKYEGMNSANRRNVMLLADRLFAISCAATTL